MRSLRTRLLAYGALVAAASLAVLVAVLVRGTRIELDTARLETRPRAPALPADVEARLRAGSPAERQAVLEALARQRGQSLLLVDPHGMLLAAAPRQDPPPTIELLADGGFQIERRSARGNALEVLQFQGGSAVRDATGRVMATLLALPPARPAPAARRPALLGALLRWILLASVAALAVAVPLGLLLARRTAAPLERLTEAARRLRGGDLGQRVPVSGADEIAELARAFNGMAEELERTEEARKRLVADVAHELRTPLTRMRAQLEAIEDKLLPLDTAVIGSLQADVLLLGRLVADLQDLALADAGRLQLRLTDVDVAALIARVAAAYEASALRADVRMRVDCEPGLELRADAERLGQVLGNLLDNALAWTPSGGAIDLTANRQGGEIVLSVIDSGPGIAAEHLPRVFDRFYRADPARTRNGRGGVGIGLAVVSALARAHGGEAEAASEVGRGARFTVRLPARSPSSQVPNNAFVTSS